MVKEKRWWHPNCRTRTEQSTTNKGFSSEQELQQLTDHFSGIAVANLNWHKDYETIRSTFYGVVEDKKGLLLRSQCAEAMHCRYKIMLHTSYLGDHIANEIGVRYVFADPIIDMLCQALGYQVELEDTFENEGYDMVNVTGKSRADYVCYILVGKENKQHPMVVIETKYSQELDNKAIAQVLGYYCKSQGKSNLAGQHGLAMLLRATNDVVQVRMFLFLITIKGRRRRMVMVCKH